METAAGWGTRVDDTPPAHVFQKPPGLVFHLLLVPGALLFLYAFSFPGGDYLLGMGMFAILGVAGLVWALRVFTFLRARKRAEGAGSTRWLAVAPIGGFLVVALLFFDAPLRARWMVARDDFEQVLRSAPPPTSKTSWVMFDVPGHIGTYEIISASRVGDAVIFYEAKGNGIDDAGFAYLPSGEFDELNTGWFEVPRFLPLGGGWYAWTASW